MLIPCHRVIRADGSIGGYAYGEAIKRELLKREQGERHGSYERVWIDVDVHPDAARELKRLQPLAQHLLQFGGSPGVDEQAETVTSA